MYLKRKRNKIALLLQRHEKIFHTQDLAVIWDITNRNTLYTALKRYVKKKYLQRIRKGIYSTVPLKKLDPIQVGLKMLHTFAYLSCETILQRHGLLNAFVPEITLVSAQSKKFSAGRYSYRSRKLHEKYLYNPAGIVIENSVQTATKERAVADMLYFNPRYNFDGPIDWLKIKHIQTILSYPLTPTRYVAASSR